jgi:hypothetical protein
LMLNALGDVLRLLRGVPARDRSADVAQAISPGSTTSSWSPGRPTLGHRWLLPPLGRTGFASASCPGSQSPNP